MPVVYGTQGDDLIDRTYYGVIDGGLTIYGLGGNDQIYGQATVMTSTAAPEPITLMAVVRSIGPVMTTRRYPCIRLQRLLGG